MPAYKMPAKRDLSNNVLSRIVHGDFMAPGADFPMVNVGLFISCCITFVTAFFISRLPFQPFIRSIVLPATHKMVVVFYRRNMHEFFIRKNVKDF